MSIGEFERLIKELKETKDFADWGWGQEAIKLIGEKIDEAKKDLLEDIPCFGHKKPENYEEYQLLCYGRCPYIDDPYTCQIPKLLEKMTYWLGARKE